MYVSDKCESVEEFGHLTVCLNKLNNILSVKTLQKYNDQVRYFLKNKITETDYRTLLNIALFLNYPKWRSQNSLLISDCLKKMKNSVGLLNVPQLQLMYLVSDHLIFFMVFKFFFSDVFKKSGAW